MSLSVPPTSVASHDAISAAGADAGIVAWTLGETVTETLTSAEALVVQGFNQPSASTATALLPTPAAASKVKAWPNPVRHTLYLGLEADKRCEWQLLDLAGRILGSGRTTSVNVAHLPPGYYLLRLTDGIDTQQIPVIKKQ